MKIVLGTGNQIENNIFFGSYWRQVSVTAGKMYEFSSPRYPISGFKFPFDAILPDSVATGRHENRAVASRIKRECPITSDITGALYFHNHATLIGTCHGYGHNNFTYYSGYNYYNAFYPVGYYSPPFGETISIFKSTLDGYDVLKNGGCSNLTVTEYNEEFGIVSKSSSEVELTSDTLVANIYAPIYSPKEACPPSVTIASYYDEFQLSNIAGNTQYLGGNDIHNGNPIPTSLDAFNIKINGRYAFTTDANEPHVHTILYTGGKPISSYTISNEENKLNNALCLASLMESKVSLGIGTNGVQLIEAPDILRDSLGGQVSFAATDPFHYWHWTFQENAHTLPFYNNFVTKDEPKFIDGTNIRFRAVGEGTPLFIPILSSEDHYWKNRQCPAVVDYLPWTFGASINACPSDYFDIPYYAAMKKFGFYGTRFLNTCKALNLDYPISGVEYASEVETGDSNVVLDEINIEPPDLDKDGNWSVTTYSNLLNVAKAEEKYSDMYALNRGFFIWANKSEITGSDDYKILTGALSNTFIYSFNAFTRRFDDIYVSGLSSFTGNEPSINLLRLDDNFTIITSGGPVSNILLTNEAYLDFKNELKWIVTGNYIVNWTNIEKAYSYYIRSGDQLNQEFYKTIISGREKRLATRYFENIIRGNPIDLFPMNSIPFSFDNAKDYIEHTGWGRRITSFGAGSHLPEIQRRYFEGAYGHPSDITGLVGIISQFYNTEVNYYYPGFFNDVRFNKVLPMGSYDKAFSGLILDSLGRRYSPSGWLGLGYHEIGKLDGNFSCFTPIFVQHPVPKTFTKIGQRPTFHSYAVDYHTIPEDKISRKYPEIIFWADRLKMLDCNGTYLYPLKYKWFRVPISGYADFLSHGDFRNAEESNSTGSWCCLEGDGPDCTLIHPTECDPAYSGDTRESHYTTIKGAIKNLDDKFYYFCMASGRFGVRITNPGELYIENWLRFDVSVKNGSNMSFDGLQIDLVTEDKHGNEQIIPLAPEFEIAIPAYGGYQQENDTAPETIIEQKIPPPNAGYGDVTAYRFLGPVGYIGGLRSYKPSTLKDTRGLREVWGHIMEFGYLVPFSKMLDQHEGDWLYGYSHLPVCSNYSMPAGRKGIKIVASITSPEENSPEGAFTISHWSSNQRAVASLDNKQGIQWDKLTNFGELYPPVNIKNETANLGIGHWQWGNNLGSIKRFGKLSTKESQDINLVSSSQIVESTERVMIEKIKNKWIGSTDLAGTNCGYHRSGLGRNMIYYIEAYERFYIICDLIKKKNVKNRSFLCPGTRFTNSAIQYFWLGKPSNTYLRRRAMYGPYAYQWQVKRHNRDRNGNGISEGFYSMGHGKKYSLLYDAPAIYGLYPKTQETDDAFKGLLRDLKRQKILIYETYGMDIDAVNIRNIWWGEARNEGSNFSYGNVKFSCDSTLPLYNKIICDYVSSAQALARNMNFKDHSCSESQSARGDCFDPCISLRYSQGFFPGGKLLDMFSNRAEGKITRLNPLAPIKNGKAVYQDQPSVVDPSYQLRSPLNTPHAKISTKMLKVGGGFLENPEFIAGISPCQDGGSDYCNYTTATFHLTTTSTLLGTSDFFDSRRQLVVEANFPPSSVEG